jgi:diacylglycerol kinase (ATP)
MKALKKKIDLVLVAGGDGSVSKVACRLVAMSSKVPLAVLPLGTANNFARSLGFCLSAKELIEQLNDGRCDTFDVGLARGPWGKRYFFEGAVRVYSRIICERQKKMAKRMNRNQKQRRCGVT